MLLVMVWLLLCLFGASQGPEPSVQSSPTSSLSHGCSWLRPPVPVAWVPQAPSPSPNALHAVLYCFGDCAHLPARFIIFEPLAELCISSIINLVFPILLIFGTFKITQTVSDSIQPLLRCCVRLCGCWLCLFNIPHMVLLVQNHCLWVSNSISFHRGLCINIMLDPFLFLFIAYQVCFPSFLCRKHLFSSSAAQSSQRLDSL